MGTEREFALGDGHTMQCADDVLLRLRCIAQEEAPWNHGLRRAPSEHQGLACQRAHVKTRLTEVSSSPALACICCYLPTAWEHFSGRNQVNCIQLF